MSKTLFLCIGLMALMVGVSGCANTFHGAGQDIENMGEWVQDSF